MQRKRLVAVTTTLIAFGAFGCGDREAAETAETVPAAETPPAAEAPAPAAPAATPATNVRVADITGNPASFAGRSVTVEADVEEVLTPQSFKLDEDAPAAGGIDNDLVVLYPRSANLSDIDDQWLNNRVRVTGTVHTFNVVEVEREIGWDLDPKIEAELEGTKPVLIARSVERVGS